MGRQFKLIGFVFVGLVLALALYSLAGIAIFDPLSRASGHPPESYLGVAFLIVLPLSLFFGSGVTGYLSSRHIATRLGLLWVAPGLYLSSAVAVKTILDLHFNRVIQWFGIELLQFAVLWFLVSWAGVAVGHYVRRAIR